MTCPRSFNIFTLTFNDTIKPTRGEALINPVVPLNRLAAELDVWFYAVKGFALGRGMAIHVVDRAEVVSREDADVIRRDLPKQLAKVRRARAAASA